MGGDNCYSETVYKFEYNDICYNDCPSKTELKIDSTYLCEDCRNYYNYEQTDCITTIEDGYYNNDTDAKTIDKCPDKCKKCSLESVTKDSCILCNVDKFYYPKQDDPLNEGSSFTKCYYKDDPQSGYYLNIDEQIFKPCYSKCESCNQDGDNQNNHCTQCKGDNIYDLVDGNCICHYFYNYEKTDCIDSIEDGYYNNDKDAKTIDKCPDKCSTCSYDSIIINNNLCSSCNIIDDYYPKEDDKNNQFYECYREGQIGYYLDKINNIYKQCYSICKKCNEGGNYNNNHCTECYNDDEYL